MDVDAAWSDREAVVDIVTRLTGIADPFSSLITGGGDNEWLAAGPSNNSPGGSRQPSTSKKTKTTHSPKFKKVRRKRKSLPETWKRNERKKAILAGEEYVNSRGGVTKARRVKPVDCSQCQLKCSSHISTEQRQSLFDHFYGMCDYKRQKNYVCRHVVEKKTLTILDEETLAPKQKTRHVTRKYFLPVSGGKVQVCKRFFEGTLSVAHGYIKHALDNAKDGRFAGQDGRGRHTPGKKKSEVDKTRDRKDTEYNPGIESHNCQISSDRKPFNETDDGQDRRNKLSQIPGQKTNEGDWRPDRKDMDYFACPVSFEDPGQRGSAAQSVEAHYTYRESQEPVVAHSIYRGSNDPVMVPSSYRGSHEPVVAPTTFGGSNEPVMAPSSYRGSQEPVMVPSSYRGSHEPVMAPSSYRVSQGPFVAPSSYIQLCPMTNEAAMAHSIYRQSQEPVVAPSSYRGLQEPVMAPSTSYTGLQEPVVAPSRPKKSRAIPKGSAKPAVKPASPRGPQNPSTTADTIYTYVPHSQKADRKRKSKPQLWRRNQRKMARLEGKEYVNSRGKLTEAKSVKPVDCSGCKLKCSSHVDAEQRQSLFDTFYGMKDHISQKDYICTHVAEEETVTVLIKGTMTPKQKRRHVLRKYFLTVDGEKVQVCKRFFTGTLSVGHAYIQHALENVQDGQFSGFDGRGKHTPGNKTSEEDMARVRKHIESFPCLESHYYPKSSDKNLLDEKLSINEMHRLFTVECKAEGVVPISSSLYRRVFVTEYR